MLQIYTHYDKIVQHLTIEIYNKIYKKTMET